MTIDVSPGDANPRKIVPASPGGATPETAELPAPEAEVLPPAGGGDAFVGPPPREPLTGRAIKLFSLAGALTGAGVQLLSSAQPFWPTLKAGLSGAGGGMFLGALGAAIIFSWVDYVTGRDEMPAVSPPA